MPPKIASRGIEIKKGAGVKSSKKGKRGTPTYRHKGKRKKHKARRDIIVEARVEWFDQQDDHH